MAAVKLFGDWEKAKGVVDTMQQKWEEASKRAMRQEAHYFRGLIVQGIREQAPGGQAFRPLAPSTLAIRKGTGFGGTKALMRRGDLRNSIVVKEEGGGAFVGIMRSAKARDGQSMVNIARMNEEGSTPIVVPITEKSRRFWHMALRKAGIDLPAKGNGVHVAVVRIRPRPFFRPIFEKYGKPDDVRDRFFKRIAKAMVDLGD